MADYLSYLKNNPDVAAWGKSQGLTDEAAAFQHYGNFGYNEGRVLPGMNEEATQYLTQNKDVADWATGTETQDPLDAIRHYMQFGGGEGRAWDSIAAASPVTGPAASPVFDMPTITPDSGTTTSNTTGQTSSGIDWGSPGVAGLLDQIKGWISTSSGLAQNAQANIGNYYNNLMRESLGPQAFQGTLNNLRSRNMLNSSVASDALATAQSNIAGDIGNRAFDTYLKGYDTQMQMPNMLTQLADVLGGRAATSADTGTATGTVNDPMAVYRLLFDNII